MDEGLLFWRSMLALPDETSGSVCVDASGPSIRARKQRFKNHLIDQGHSEVKAESISVGCAEFAQRNNQ